MCASIPYSLKPERVFGKFATFVMTALLALSIPTPSFSQQTELDTLKVYRIDSAWSMISNARLRDYASFLHREPTIQATLESCDSFRAVSKALLQLRSEIIVYQERIDSLNKRNINLRLQQLFLQEERARSLEDALKLSNKRGKIILWAGVGVGAVLLGLTSYGALK